MNTSMRTLQRRRSRGQAAVELSLMGIIIVPTFLYILFIDDLLRFRLDQQEAMVTSGWDFSTVNYDVESSKAKYIPKDGKAGNGSSNIHEAVETFSRFQFYDHSVASPRIEYVSGNLIGDSKQDQNHHNGVGAQQCWLVGGAKNQVSCVAPDVDVATNYTFDGTGGARPDVKDFLMAGPVGGMYSSKGRVGVINHWLPSGTLFFSKVELSSRKYHGVNSSKAIDINGVGSDTVGKSITTNDSKTEDYHFPADEFAILTNPWAMSEQDDNGPNSHSGALYNRVDKVYNANLPKAGLVAVMAMYPLQAMAKGLLQPEAYLTDTILGDNIYTPEIAFTNKYQPQISGYAGGKFYSSQYWDFSGNPVDKTYKARGTWYLGSTAMPP
jgi:hypothetical protein